jgi:hypothetical protein
MSRADAPIATGGASRTSSSVSQVGEWQPENSGEPLFFFLIRREALPWTGRPGPPPVLPPQWPALPEVQALPAFKLLPLALL